jgi:hypothetical protein
VLRRYSDLATLDELPVVPDAAGGFRLVREAEEADRVGYFRQRRLERQRQNDQRVHETLPLEERAYNVLRFLCHRVGTLMAYALPADGRFDTPFPLRLPRIEVLVDLGRAPGDWEHAYRRLLAAFTDEGTLVPDGDHPDGSEIKLILPLACREAHRAAVFADDVHRRDVERKIVGAVGAIRARESGTV